MVRNERRKLGLPLIRPTQGARSPHLAKAERNAESSVRYEVEASDGKFKRRPSFVTHSPEMRLEPHLWRHVHHSNKTFGHASRDHSSSNWTAQQVQRSHRKSECRHGGVRYTSWNVASFSGNKQADGKYRSYNRPKTFETTPLHPPAVLEAVRPCDNSQGFC